jgi:chromosome transmission fidelity protein 18
LETKVISALESHRMGRGGDSGKPTLVVMDEVDGVAAGGQDKAFISRLVAWANTPLDGVEREKGGRRKKGKKSRPLLRPIICICNNLY